MYCKKCGNKLKENDNFCIKCGNSVKETINNKVDSKKNNGKAVASLVLGIIALTFSFSLSILMFPLSITGLILGIVNKNKCSEKTTGIILNVASMVVEIVVFLILLLLIFLIADSYDKTDYPKEIINNDSNYVFNCKTINELDYSVSLTLNSNKSYVWAKYNDVANNAIYGSYSTDELSENKYSLILSSTYFLDNGIIQNYENTSNYEMYFDNEYDLILTNLNNGSKYYCDATE